MRELPWRRWRGWRERSSHPGVARRAARRIDDLKQLIVRGIPERGMPGFALPEARVQSIAEYVRSLGAPAIESPAPGDAEAGRKFFFGSGRLRAVSHDRR